MPRSSIACLSFLTLAACGEFPRDYYVDVRYNAAEYAEVKSAVAEVNRLAKLVDADELINLAGRFTDDNDAFEQNNVDNDRNEIYRIGEAEECLGFVDRYRDKFGDLDDLYGYYTGTDIGILMFNSVRDNRPLKFLIMHELGHAVGMKHVTGNRNAVMHPHACCAENFTQADREQFCLQHGCDPD